MLEKNTYSRGLLFLEASKIVENKNFDNFEIILFCNFFYLHNTEKKVFKEIYKKGKAIFIFQGSSKEWTVLDKNFKDLGITNHFIEEKRNQCNFFLYQGFDIQSQCVIVRHILQNISNIENTVIVLPQPQTLIPLLTEISSIVKEFNVSLGYPLERSSIYSLLRNIAKTQETKKENKYYTKDYINLLKHPLVENLKLVNNLETTRVIIHKLEELLQGKLEKNYISSITGKLFLDLEEVENEKIIYELSKTTLVNMGISAEIDDCKTVILKLHYLFFKIWENSNTFKKFAENLEIILNLLIEKSTVFSFPFNLKILEKFYEITKEFATLSFKDELFPLYDIWKIFMKKIENEVISFVGSPLKNLQILGLFETRSLTFENVIIIDVNETVFPKLRLYEPFIPREVMINLGLNRLEKEEEIQRYHFKSLISGAKNIYLVYEKTEEKEKSRFIEELLWNLQKEKKSLDVIEIPKIFFPMEIILKKHCVEKTTLVLEFLKNQIYSANRLNTYLDCPMKFYYEYVLGLEKEEELLNEPQSEHIGNFIHSLLEETFSNFKNRKPIIDQKFKKYFFKVMEERFKNNLLPRMKADYYLLKKILQYRLENFLKLEAKRNTRRILCLEEEKNDIIILNNEKINFVYRVDRIDELEDGKILIIDYKTGTKDIVPNRLGSLEKMEMNIASIRENIKSFQLPLYYYFISQRLSQKEINVEVCNLRTLEKKYFISEKDWEKKEKILEICMEALKVVLEEIFNP
ncbi:MAG: PD-(D/E)XK nuclease family protein, partial [Candidatus Aenigmatarchaeota archaeon]